MVHTVLQTYHLQGIPGKLPSLLSAETSVNKRQLHILQCVQIGDQIKSLEDKSNLPVAYL